MEEARVRWRLQRRCDGQTKTKKLVSSSSKQAVASVRKDHGTTYNTEDLCY